MKWHSATAIAVAVGFNCSVQAEQDPFAQMKREINDKNYAQAFAFGQVLIDEWAGEKEFDFLLGLASFKSGLFDDAVFAFERVLINDPRDLTARLYLAFSYFNVENYQAAKTELSELRKLPLKAADLALVNDYLSKIQTVLEKQTRSHSFGTSIAYAADSNANSGTSLDTIDLPFIGEITLFDSSKKTSDRIFQASVQYQYREKLDQKSGYFVQLAASKTDYQSLSKFNRTIQNVYAGYYTQYSGWQLSANAYLQPMTLGGQSYRNVTGALLDASYPLNETSTLGLTLSGARIDNKQNDNLDLNQYSLSGKYDLNRQDHKHRLELAFGKESARLTEGEYNGRDYWQLAYTYTLTNLYSGALSANISYQDMKYDDIHPLFGQIRDDQQTSLQISYNYPLYDNVSSQIRYKLTDRNSSVALYAFDKNELWLTLNYNF